MAYLSTMAHRGDPGFFGAIGRTLRGAAVGMLTGGPVGAVMGAAGGLANVPGAGLPSTTAQMYSGQLPISRSTTTWPTSPRTPPMALPQVPGVSLGGMGPPPIAGTSMPQVAGGACPKGYRPNKSSYFLKSGEFVPAGSRCVRYRTRNNLNQKALRRAIGRAQGFDKLVKRNRKALRGLSRI